MHDSCSCCLCCDLKLHLYLFVCAAVGSTAVCVRLQCAARNLLSLQLLADLGSPAVQNGTFAVVCRVVFSVCTCSARGVCRASSHHHLQRQSLLGVGTYRCSPLPCSSHRSKGIAIRIKLCFCVIYARLLEEVAGYPMGPCPHSLHSRVPNEAHTPRRSGSCTLLHRSKIFSKLVSCALTR